MKQTLTIIIYKALDWLKQESPFWWFVSQSVIWASMALVYTNTIPTTHKEAILSFLMALSGGVGTRTSKKLSEIKEVKQVNPDKFKEDLNKAMDKVTHLDQVIETPLIIKDMFLNKGQWVNEKVNKTQIVVHHSVGSSVQSLFNWWNMSKERVATALSIDKDGTIYRHFPEDEWAYHLYINAKTNRVGTGLKRFAIQREKDSIGIELINAGGLIKKDKWYSSYNSPVEDVYEIDYRGFKAFEKYTDEQMRSLKKLIEHLSNKFNIPITNLTFDINDDALKGKPGVYGHINYRSEKSDPYEYPPLINLIKELKDATP